MNGNPSITHHAALIPKRYSKLLDRLQSFDPQLFVGPVPQNVYEQVKHVDEGFIINLGRDELLMVTFTDPIKAYLLSEVASCYWAREQARTPFDRWLDEAIAKENKPAEPMPTETMTEVSHG
jgi:hypothetical protein